MFRVKNSEFRIKNAVLSLMMVLLVPALFAQAPDTVQSGVVNEVTIEFERPTV